VTHQYGKWANQEKSSLVKSDQLCNKAKKQLYASPPSLRGRSWAWHWQVNGGVMRRDAWMADWQSKAPPRHPCAQRSRRLALLWATAGNARSCMTSCPGKDAQEVDTCVAKVQATQVQWWFVEILEKIIFCEGGFEKCDKTVSETLLLSKLSQNSLFN